MKDFTFRNSKECDNNNSILVCSAQRIAEVAERKIEWIVLRISCHNRDGGLVAAEKNRDKESAVVAGFFSKNVLESRSVLIFRIPENVLLAPKTSHLT